MNEMVYVFFISVFYKRHEKGTFIFHINFDLIQLLKVMSHTFDF